MAGITNPYNPKKILAHPERLKLILKGKITHPITIEVDPVDGICNSFCAHCCFAKFGSKPVFIKIKPLFRSLEGAAQKGVLAVELVGGTEPLMHKEINSIIKTIVSYNLEVGLITNGILLKKIFPVASKLTFIRVSLGAGTCQTYSQVHGIDCFREVTENIKLLAANYTNSKKIGIAFLCLPQNSSQKEIYSAVELGARLKLGYIAFRPAILPKAWNPEYLDTVGQRILFAKQKLGQEIKVFSSIAGRRERSRVQRREDKGPCLACSLTGIIMADGNVPFCNLFRGKKEFYIGNIYRQSFSEIWDGERHKRMIGLVNISTCPVPCKTDDYRKVLFDYQKWLSWPQKRYVLPKVAACAHQNFI